MARKQPSQEARRRGWRVLVVAAMAYHRLLSSYSQTGKIIFEPGFLDDDVLLGFSALEKRVKYYWMYKYLGR